MTLNDPVLKSKVAGILVESLDVAHMPRRFSPGDPFPQVELSTTPHSKYAWNQFGTGASHRKWDFPVVALSREASEIAVQKAQSNAVKQFEYPMHGVTFNYEMHAKGDSKRQVLNPNVGPPHHAT
eukprot:1191970-Prorocentrum_minimum.AAC.4